MKVPHEVIGRTKPSGQGLDYFRVDSGPAVAGLQQVASALGNLGAELERRDSTASNFDALSKFSDFQLSYAERQAELSRVAQPNDLSFRERSEALFDNMSNELLSKLPADRVEEYRARLAATKVGAMGEVINFDYKQKDAWYRTEIDKNFELAKNKFAANPTPEMFEQLRKNIEEITDATDLSAAEKMELKYKQMETLRNIAYSEALKKGEWGGKSVKGGTPGVKLEKTMSGRAGQARAFFEARGYSPHAASALIGTLIQESGLQTDAYNPRDPGGSVGLGQWNRERKAALFAFAKARGADWKDFTTQLEFIDHELKTNEKAWGDKLRGAKTLDEAADAAISYERPVGWSANNPRGGHGYANRLKNAQSVLGGKVGQVPEAVAGTSLDSDPFFASVPYETRLALQADAARAQNAAAAEAARAQKEQQDALMNAFKISVYKGEAGMKEITDALDAGKIDFDESAQLRTIYDKRKKDLEEGLNIQDKLTEGMPLGEGEHNKLFDVEDGAERLFSGDFSYGNQLKARAAQTHDIPTEAISILNAMRVNTDPNKALFAYNTLSGMFDASLQAFNRRVGGDLGRDVLLYRELRRTRSDAEALDLLRGGDTSEQLNAMQILRDNGGKVFEGAGSSPGVSFGAEQVNNFLDDYGPLAEMSFVGPVFADWYRANWLANYQKSRGDAEAATAATNEYAATQWTVFDVGGRKQLMLHAPTNIGLPVFEGSYQWMADQLREAKNMKPGETFQLLADPQTREELARWQAAGGKVPAPADYAAYKINKLLGVDALPAAPLPPSYGVIRFDENGVARADSLNDRFRFAPTPALQLREEELFALDQLRQQIKRFAEDVLDVPIGEMETGEYAGSEGQKVYEEHKRQYWELVNRYNAEYERLFPREEKFDPTALPQAFPEGLGGTVTEPFSPTPLEAFDDVKPPAVQKLPPVQKRKEKFLNNPYPPGGPTHRTPLVFRKEGPINPVTDKPILTEKPEQRAAWWEFWKTSGVEPPEDFDPTKKFTTFATARNVKEIQALWDAATSAPKREEKEAVDKLLAAFPKEQLSQEASDKLNDLLTASMDIPLLKLGLKNIDPSRVVVYKGANELNKGGTYTPGTDWMFFEEKYPVAFVHEVAHKAVAELRADLAPREQRYLDKYIELFSFGTPVGGFSGEEALVRYLMNYELYFFNMPELGMGEDSNKHIKGSRTVYGQKEEFPLPKTDKKRTWWPLYDTMNSLNRLAEEKLNAK